MLRNHRVTLEAGQTQELSLELQTLEEARVEAARARGVDGWREMIRVKFPHIKKQVD